MQDNRLERVEKALLHNPDPVATAPALAEYDELDDLGRRQVLDELRLLERSGEVESQQAGASAVVWWHVDRVTPAPPKDPADHPDQSGLRESATHAHNARDSEPEPESADAPIAVDDLDSELEDALASWDPGRSIQERRERRRIGFDVLRWLRDREDSAQRADIRGALYDDLSLEGQGKDAWWRRCVRPALSHAADAGFVDDSGRSYLWEENLSGSENMGDS